MTSTPIRLTHSSHIDCSDLAIETQETDLTALICSWESTKNRVWTDKNLYRLYAGPRLVFETDNLYLAIERYNQITGQTERTQKSKDSNSPYVEGCYHCLESVQGKTRLTGYFNHNAVYSVQQESPGVWSVLFSNSDSTELGPLKQAQADLIQLIDQVPHSFPEQALKIPLSSYYLSPLSRSVAFVRPTRKASRLNSLMHQYTDCPMI